ncbi:MAG TPA: GNAT family N-acetyltransferase [Thermoanaerobaculia bacterium]|nr:GNAT family N-acetyltransferase [Thermoanaerobaculia bacterium]
MAVAIRQAREQDREVILAIMKSANMHHVPSPEMPELDIGSFFVATVDGRPVGAAGYKLLSPSRAKTTLMAVLPELKGLGIGKRLQRRRMSELKRLGVKVLTTNADLPATIEWYRRHFGYRVVGSLAKVHEFGAPDIARWTTLEANLEEWVDE